MDDDGNLVSDVCEGVRSNNCECIVSVVLIMTGLWQCCVLGDVVYVGESLMWLLCKAFV